MRPRGKESSEASLFVQRLRGVQDGQMTIERQAKELLVAFPVLPLCCCESEEVRRAMLASAAIKSAAGYMYSDKPEEHSD